ncbi:hypothetical protein, (similar to IcmE protein), partial CDS, partial [Candidatus Phytoplasma solani]
MFFVFFLIGNHLYQTHQNNQNKIINILQQSKDIQKENQKLKNKLYTLTTNLYEGIRDNGDKEYYHFLKHQLVKTTKTNGLTKWYRFPNTTISELQNFGATLKDLINVGFLPSDFQKAGFDVKHLKNVGCVVQELKSVGYSLQAMITAGFTLLELKTSYTVKELQQAGYSASEMLLAGFTLLELK